MLRFFGWLLKATIFAALVLVASHLIHWKGRTVSDQVRSSISSAQRSKTLKTIQRQSRSIIEDAQRSVDIDAEDRERLQALIDSEDS